MNAVVFSYMPNRRFGFLKTEDGKEVFFHLSNYLGIPKLGVTVTFDYGDPIRMGLPQQAVNVRMAAQEGGSNGGAR